MQQHSLLLAPVLCSLSAQRPVPDDSLPPVEPSLTLLLPPQALQRQASEEGARGAAAAALEQEREARAAAEAALKEARAAVARKSAMVKELRGKVGGVGVR